MQLGLAVIYTINMYWFVFLSGNLSKLVLQIPLGWLKWSKWTLKTRSESSNSAVCEVIEQGTMLSSANSLRKGVIPKRFETLVSFMPWKNHDLAWLAISHICPLYISFSEACVWLEARAPRPLCQWVCGAERPGLEYRVRGSCGGRKSAGQIRAWRPLCENGYRAHHHPRYDPSPHPEHPHTPAAGCKGFHRDHKSCNIGSMTVNRAPSV